MAYEVIMPYHLHMPSYFLETFTEYPEIIPSEETVAGFQWYITQGVNLLLTKVDIEFSIL